jgi:hypothetical protein
MRVEKQTIRERRFDSDVKDIHNRMPMTMNQTLSPAPYSRKTRFFDSNAF